MSRRVRVHQLLGVIAVALVLAGFGFVAATWDGSGSAAADAGHPTFGSLPASAAGAPVDMSQLPGYISVVGRDGKVAGYGRATDMFGPHPDGFPVYDRDLNVVGTEVPRQGFVPNGVDPASLPSATVTTVLGRPAG